MELKFKRRLHEALNIEGAEHIGSANGYDVYKITTFEAAQQFTVEDRNDLVGTAYTHSESTFNQHINDSVNLFVFAESDSNRVYGAVVTGAGNGYVTIYSPDRAHSVRVQINGQFENAGNNSDDTDRLLPFFLIPGFERFDKGLYIVDGYLKAVLRQFGTCPDELDLSVIEDIQINPKAFCFTNVPSTLIVDVTNNLLGNPFEARSSFDTIKFKNSEEDVNTIWPDGWNRFLNAVPVFDYGIDPAEVARRKAEKEEQERQERERREREEAERRAAEQAEAERRAEEARLAAERAEEQRRLAAEREARKIRYKVVGNEVTINGTRKGVTDLEIPEEIEGKPVTRIAALAFYDNQELEHIKIPSTMKFIERSAFEDCEHLHDFVKIPDKCILGKNAFKGTSVRIYRA